MVGHNSLESKEINIQGLQQHFFLRVKGNNLENISVSVKGSIYEVFLFLWYTYVLGVYMCAHVYMCAFCYIHPCALIAM